MKEGISDHKKLFVYETKVTETLVANTLHFITNSFIDIQTPHITERYLSFPRKETQRNCFVVVA